MGWTPTGQQLRSGQRATFDMADASAALLARTASDSLGSAPRTSKHVPPTETVGRRVIVPRDDEHSSRLGGRPGFATAVEHALSRAECAELIEETEGQGDKKSTFAGDSTYAVRHCSKRSVNDQARADRLFERVRSFLPQEWTDEDGKRWVLHRVHEYMKFLRYVGKPPDSR